MSRRAGKQAALRMGPLSFAAPSQGQEAYDEAAVSVDLSSAEGVYKLCPSCHYIYPAADRFCARDRSELQIDERIFAGKYILLRKIGEGSMGAVHEAEQPQMGRKVAVKILRSTPEVMLRFEREVQAAGALNHRNVVTIYDSGLTADGCGFIAMEYLEGESLAQHLETAGPLSPGGAMSVWHQAVRAMSAAHAKGIVHRDLKPDNMFLSKQHSDEGSEPVLKVLDFGIAKFHKRPAPAKGTTPGMIIGTMQYMAPEQLQGAEADPRADVYALGLILVEMMTGRLPWGQNKEQGYAQFALRMVQPPQSLSELRPQQSFSPELQRIVSEMLATEPEQRPAHAGEILQRLKQVPEFNALGRADQAPQGEASELPRPSTQQVRPMRLFSRIDLWGRQKRLRMPIAAAAVFFVSLGLYLALRRPAEVPSTGPQTVQTPSVPTAPKAPDPAPEKPTESVPSATKSSSHRPSHAAALQVQFAVTDAKGVSLSCSGKRLGAPSCSAAGICKWLAQVSAGQRCVAEKGSGKKVFSYAELSRTPPDRKNLIHVLIRF